MSDVLESLAFDVVGTPVPQGSKKGFVVGRRAVIVDDNKVTLKVWRNLVKAAAVDALAERHSFVGAVTVTLTFWMPRPKTVKRLRPFVKPDLDKLARAILDSLTDSHVLADDGQVVTLSARKFYADDEPGVSVRVYGGVS